MAIAQDQSAHVMAALGGEVKDLDRYAPGDPAPYINCRPWGVVTFLAGHYGGDDQRLKQQHQEVVSAMRWTLKELERRGEITTHRDGGLVAGVWLGNVPRPGRGRKKLAVNDREVVMARDGWACVLCGATSDLTLDHIFPVVEGGSDDPINLRVLCRSCNCRKGADVPEQILRLGAVG